MIVRLNIPKTLIYAKSQDDTYGIDILEDFNLLMFNIYSPQKLRDSDIDIYFYNVECQEYEFLCSTKIDINQELINNSLSIITTENVKFKLQDFIKKIALPELNISPDEARFIEMNGNSNLIKYPTTIDRVFKLNMTEQIKKHKNDLLISIKNDAYSFSKIECALTLSSRRKMHQFIECDCFDDIIDETDSFTSYWYNNFVSRIYVGSQFCPLKNSNVDEIEKVIQKCYKLGKSVTISTSYITEISLPNLNKIINLIELYYEKFNYEIEIIVNDYATLNLLQNHKHIKKNLGVLLNRRQKDPRYIYRWGIDKKHDVLVKNFINSEKHQELIEFYKQFSKIEYENNPIGNCYSKLDNTVHFPLFQTNTSRYCPMNAAIVNRNSNNQYNVIHCKEYCNDFYYQYADNMSLIGIGNSNFGICTDLSEVKNAINQGQIKRLVWNWV